MFFNTHVLNLLLKLFHLVLSLVHDVISTHTIRSLTVLDLVVVLLFHVINVLELDLVVFFIVTITTVTSEAAWFDKEHDWNQNDNNNEESKSNANFGFDITSNECFVAWSFSFTEVEDGIDHEINYRWGSLVITVAFLHFNHVLISSIGFKSSAFWSA